jgi:hypothetical protein
MNKLNCIFSLLMLIATATTYACTGASGADCMTPMRIADARSDEDRMRYRYSDEAEQQAPLTVRVTTFDGSLSTPGTWYERPRSQIEEESLSQQPVTPRAPFDRHGFERGAD